MENTTLRGGRYRKSTRRAISPLIATVVIIATTLIASVAISGFVYGFSSSAENNALVEVTGIMIPTTVNLGVTVVVCSPNSGNSFGGYVQLYNSGTVATYVNSLVFTYAGVTLSVAPSGIPGVSCTVPPESSLYLLVISLPVSLSSPVGSPYTGYVSTSNGADVLFLGSFD
ncbi:MAG TPA: archaellin/type IV pilin N-terminal domain-containing protein [Nitrososphaerales archaeon]|nr:archaellin/type IV pilin N-terminal domain-containing protein [Nitrososphaerales archaeon]